MEVSRSKSLHWGITKWLSLLVELMIRFEQGMAKVL